jgi:hypothetical protein
MGLENVSSKVIDFCASRLRNDGTAITCGRYHAAEIGKIGQLLACLFIFLEQSCPTYQCPLGKKISFRLTAKPAPHYQHPRLRTI